MAFQAGMGPEAGATDFAIKRRFGIMRLGDVTLELPIHARAKGAFFHRAMNHLHMVNGVFILDFFFAKPTRLQHRGLPLRVATSFSYEPRKNQIRNKNHKIDTSIQRASSNETYPRDISSFASLSPSSGWNPRVDATYAFSASEGRRRLYHTVHKRASDVNPTCNKEVENEVYEQIYPHTNQMTTCSLLIVFAPPVGLESNVGVKSQGAELAVERGICRCVFRSHVRVNIVATRAHVLAKGTLIHVGVAVSQVQPRIHVVKVNIVFRGADGIEHVPPIGAVEGSHVGIDVDEGNDGMTQSTLVRGHQELLDHRAFQFVVTVNGGPVS